MMKNNNKKKGSTAKKLMPAAMMLAVSASMLGTSTYAWFTMNKEVTVTGMEVHTTVGSNLLISETTVDSTTAKADSTFKTSDVDALPVALLEPVSTINGVNYFYTNTNNVAGDGDVLSDAYTAYSTESSALTAFNTNYGTSGAVGYVDYAFELKANNTTGSPQDINVTDISLIYGGTDTAALPAFRTAIFVEDLGVTGNRTAPAGASAVSTSNLITILDKNGTSTYFDTGKAVDGVDSRAALNAKYQEDATIGSVANGATQYYKVIVRLWIEGEDTTCNNSIFNTLKDNWALNLTIKLDNTATDTLNTSAGGAKIDLTSATASGENTKIIDGITYYPITGSSPTVYADASGAITASSKIFKIQTIDGSEHPFDVTNQYTLPNA